MGATPEGVNTHRVMLEAFYLILQGVTTTLERLNVASARFGGVFRYQPELDEMEGRIVAWPQAFSFREIAEGSTDQMDEASWVGTRTVQCEWVFEARMALWYSGDISDAAKRRQAESDLALDEAAYSHAMTLAFLKHRRLNVRAAEAALTLDPGTVGLGEVGLLDGSWGWLQTPAEKWYRLGVWKQPFREFKQLATSN